MLYIGSFIYAPCIALIKLSILSLFWSAFPTKLIRRSTIVLALLTISWAIACWLVGAFACLPIHKAWEPQTPGSCIDYDRYYYGLQIPNIITDFVMLGLPFWPVSRLRLPLETKLLLLGVLGLSLV